MRLCADGKAAFLRCGLVAAAALAMLAAWGCRSGPASKKEESSGAEQKSAATAQQGADPGIDLNCVADHIQNPPEAFHYSYKKDSSNPVHEEADITPQTIDGAFSNNSGSHPIHGVRSDSQSWQGAWSGLMGIAGMSSAIAIVRNSSAMVREGAEQVNGYDTIKYSIDTARATAAEQGLYRSVLGEGGFEKGAAWVTAQGCPVKLSMDSELHSRDGSVEKIHYEEAMIRK